MGRSKSKKKKWSKVLPEEPENVKVPIEALPEKYLWMRVKSGTKIRNVLEYALKKFDEFNAVVWTGIGRGVEKAVSCAELFKRKHENLHQINKLRYIASDASKQEHKNSSVNPRYTPEIHILLAKELKSTAEPGYQDPGDPGHFFKNSEDENSKKKNGKKTRQESGTGMSCIDAEEFAAMGLRTGQKRPKKEQQAETPLKKNKRKGDSDR